MVGRQLDNQAARVQQERDAAWNASAATLLGKLEDVTHLATMDRLDRDLDQLVADGALAADDRVRLAVDQSREHLARVVRAAEQSGADSFAILRDAITGRELDTATSVAQVLATRIERAGAISGMPTRTPPERLPAHWQAHYGALQEAARERSRVLGTEVAQQQPAWAMSALGAVPDDPVQRLEWEARAGTVAAYREATNWTHETVPIGGPGARTETEQRALFADAWDALGRPEAGRPEAGMTTGQLRARVAAWERARTWAPPRADTALRQAELDADAARTRATLARAAADTDRADQLDAEAEQRGAVARAMDAVAAGRASWVADTAWTRIAHDAAAEELTRRGMTPGAEEDRTSAEEWLVADQAARRADDAHRTVTENDLTQQNDDHTDDAGQADDVPIAVVVLDEPDGPDRAYEDAPVKPTDVELDAYLQEADRAVDRAADHASQESAHQDDEHALTEHDLAADDPVDFAAGELIADQVSDWDGVSVPVAE
jgi:hypothetical protein